MDNIRGARVKHTMELVETLYEHSTSRVPSSPARNPSLSASEEVAEARREGAVQEVALDHGNAGGMAGQGHLNGGKRNIRVYHTSHVRNKA